METYIEGGRSIRPYSDCYYYYGAPATLVDSLDPEFYEVEVVESHVKQLIQAFRVDDSQEFCKILKNELDVGCLLERGYLVSPSLILWYAIKFQALQCARSMLLGTAATGYSVNVDIAASEFLMSPIFLAATEFLPDYVELLLTHGARLDFPCHCSSDYYMMLPLQASLEALREKISWTQAQSVYELIFSLCSNVELQRAFRTISHIMTAGLIEHTQNFIYHYAVEGKIVELTVLLYVDAISGLGILKRLSHREYLELRGCVPTNLTSFSEGELYFAVDGNGLSVSMDKRKLMMSVVLLLEIFYRTKFSMLEFSTGNEILAKRINDAGFDLTNGDLQNLGDLHGNHFGATKVIKHLKTMDGLPRGSISTKLSEMRIRPQRPGLACYYHTKHGISSTAQTFQKSQRFKSRFLSTLCTPMDARAQVVKTSHEGSQLLASSLRKLWPVFASTIRRTLM